MLVPHRYILDLLSADGEGHFERGGDEGRLIFPGVQIWPVESRAIFHQGDIVVPFGFDFDSSTFCLVWELDWHRSISRSLVTCCG